MLGEFFLLRKNNKERALSQKTRIDLSYFNYLSTTVIKILTAANLIKLQLGMRNK